MALANGDRVEMAPHTDRWARGDRFGLVYLVGTSRFDRDMVYVRLDRSHDVIRVHVDNLV